jgi:hypothetical protein
MAALVGLAQAAVVVAAAALGQATGKLQLKFVSTSNYGRESGASMAPGITGSKI